MENRPRLLSPISIGLANVDGDGKYGNIFGTIFPFHLRQTYNLRPSFRYASQFSDTKNEN